MSEKKDLGKLSLLQQFMQQRDAFVQESIQLQNRFQQVQGAIFACNQMIEKTEKDVKEKMQEIVGKVNNFLTPNENLGEMSNGQTNDESTEEVA